MPDSPYILRRHQGNPPAAPGWFHSALAQSPRQQFFESDGTRIELLSWGNPANPGLLFLHGNGAHAHWWCHIAPFFSGHWHCAALSWSGMGNSGHRSEGYTRTTLAREAREAVSAAGLNAGSTPPIIIGHSMGGMIGLAAATGDIPFRALVTIDSPVEMDMQQLGAIRARAPKPRSEHRSFPTLAEGLASFRLSPPQPCSNDFIVDYIARHSLKQVESGWQWNFDPQRVTMDATQTESLLGKLDCPMAYIYGEQSSLLTRETLALSLAALPPGTPVIAIPDASHHIMLDQPLALVSALRGLLSCWPTT